MSILNKRGSFVWLGLIWFGLIVAGFFVLAGEEYRPAPPGVRPTTFPAGSALPLDQKRPTLLVFVHPQCPCTRATFHNLDRIRNEVGGKLAVTIIFVLPPGVPPGWEKGDLWTDAAQMPGVHIFRDVNGIETRRFGVRASGHVLVFARNGRLLFSGGVTSSRGDEGDSSGEIAIVNLTKGPVPPDTVEKPVFGCTLL